MKFNKILLFLLDATSSLYRLAGVDYAQLRTIVAVKLMMDDRRPMMSMGQQSSSRGFNFALLIYLIFGFLVSLIIYALPSVVISMTIVFAYIMVMVVMVLITDFSSVLLDTSDNSIILPRPVSSRTLLAARVTHIVLYVGQLVVAISLGSIIAVAIQYSISAFITFLITLLLAVVFSITLTNALYLLIMRFTSEERLKNIINYLQIAMTVVFMGGYQLLPRMMGSMEDVQATFEFHIWSYLIPPLWFAATIEAVQSATWDVTHFAFVLLSVLVPVSSLLLVTRYLAPVFTEKIQDIGIESGTKKAGKATWVDKLMEVVAAKGPARSGFILTVKALARDRKLKLKVYPSIGYFVVLVFVFALRYGKDEGSILETLQAGKAYLLFLYFSALVVYTAYFEIAFTENFKAAWIFQSVPLQKPGSVMGGSLLALLVSLLLPFFLIISVVVLAIWGTTVIDDLVFGFFNNLVMLMCIVIINKKQFPQSVPDGARMSSGNFARGILMMLVMGGLGFLHYGISMISWATWALTPLFAVGVYFMFKSYRELSWQEFMKE